MKDDRVDWLAPVLVSVALLGGYYGLEKLLSQSGWAVHSDEHWQILASGWELLPYCWPIFVAGIFAGWSLFEILQVCLWERTRGRQLTRYLREEQRAKMDARRQARVELAERETVLTRLLRAVEQREAAMDLERDAWRAHNLDMQQQLRDEHDRANLAESKLCNASGATERHKRRTNKSGGGSNLNPSKGF
jgi:hypothetical protein